MRTIEEIKADLKQAWGDLGPSSLQTELIQAQDAEIARLRDAAEMLWVVLANVSGGDWEKQTEEWQEAAKRWRDNYFAVLRRVPPLPHLKVEAWDKQDKQWKEINHE